MTKSCLRVLLDVRFIFIKMTTSWRTDNCVVIHARIIRLKREGDAQFNWEILSSKEIQVVLSCVSFTKHPLICQSLTILTSDMLSKLAMMTSISKRSGSPDHSRTIHRTIQETKRHKIFNKAKVLYVSFETSSRLPEVSQPCLSEN